MTTPEVQPEAQQGVDWLKLLGFTVGEEIVVFPLGIAATGQALQGKLVDIAFAQGNPTLVVIQNGESPVCSIPWSSIMMITKATGPAVSVPQPDISVDELIEFAEKQGIEIPAEIRNLEIL